MLDNLDQLAENGATAIVHWLRRAPDTRFLCTSRRMLGASAEYAYEIGPMSLPTSPEQADGEAVMLFMDRAVAAEPTFPADDASVRSKVARLVTELEGLPLAIEIAAAQVVHSSPEEILKRLPAARLALEADAVDGEARHTSLARALDGSWDLLSRQERDVLAQLSVFRGGFDLPAVQSIVRAPSSAPPIVDLLVGLRRKSWLKAGTGAAGDVRWDMYEAVRHYAAARLEQEPERANATRERHTSYFARLVNTQRKKPPRPNDGHARLSLLDELDNLRAAHDSLLPPLNMGSPVRLRAHGFSHWARTCGPRAAQNVAPVARHQGRESNAPPHNLARVDQGAHAPATRPGGGLSADRTIPTCRGRPSSRGTAGSRGHGDSLRVAASPRHGDVSSRTMLSCSKGAPSCGRQGSNDRHRP